MPLELRGILRATDLLGLLGRLDPLLASLTWPVFACKQLEQSRETTEVQMSRMTNQTYMARQST